MGNRIVSFSLKYRYFIALALFCLIFTCISWYISKLQDSLMQEASLRNAALYSQALASFRSIYTSEVVTIAKKNNLKITHDYQNHKDAIPLPATLSMILGKHIGEKNNNTQTKLYSAYPFPWHKDNGGLTDQFSQEAWHHLTQQPNKPYYRFEHLGGVPVLRYATADKMQPTCVSCHNNHKASPKTDWATNDVSGVLEVIYPITHQMALAQRTSTEIGILLFTLSFFIIGGITLLLRQQVKNKKELDERVKIRTKDLQNAVRKRLLAESELRKNKAILDAAISAAGHAFITINSKGTITQVNEMTCKLFEYSEDELIGKTIDLLANKQDNSNFHLEKIQQYVSTGKSDVVGQHREFMAIKKSGKQFYVLLTVVDITAGKETVFTGLIQDISQWKALEYNLENHNKQLEQEVELRTKALTEAIQIAETANAAKSEFLANMTHEMRTPLHAIMGFTGRAINRIDSWDKEKQLDNLQKVMMSSEHLLLLINDLLEISKLEHGDRKLNLTNFCINELIKSTLDQLYSLYESKNISISQQHNEDTITIKADKKLLTQVLINLLSNAIKFTPENGYINTAVQLAHYQINSEEKIPCLKFSITDSGIGIPGDDLENIFDKFTQSKRTKTGAGGTGLGLAICQEIITLHGGTIHAENNKNISGATFIFVIPLNIEDQLHEQ